MKSQFQISFFIAFSAITIFNLQAQNDGSLDVTFGSNGIITQGVGGAKCIQVQSDGKILTAGNNGSDVIVSRYKVNGILDISFTGDGTTTTTIGSNTLGNIPSEILVEPIFEGDIYVVGTSGFQTSSSVWAIKYNAYGSPITTYGQNGVAGIIQGQAKAAALAPDGKLLVAGVYIPSTNAQQNDFFLARLNLDGSFDTSFGGGDGVLTTDFSSQDFANSIAIQSDGKIVVSGGANGGWTAIARYNDDGSLDNSFGQFGRVVVNSVTQPSIKVEILPSGKLFSLGYYGGAINHDYALMKFNSDGSLDNTFDGDGILNKNNTDISVLNDMEVQADGKLIIAGAGNNPLGPADFMLLRYNQDGTLDNSFNNDGIVLTHVGDGNDLTISSEIAEDIEIQTDGKIIAGGTKQLIPNGGINIGLARYTSTVVGVSVASNIQENISIFPNPLRESNATLEFVLKTNCQVTISVIDLNGRLISAKNLGTLAAGKQGVELEVPDIISSNAFLIKILAGNTEITQSILKVK